MCLDSVGLQSFGGPNVDRINEMLETLNSYSTLILYNQLVNSRHDDQWKFLDRKHERAMNAEDLFFARVEKNASDENEM